MAKAKERTKSRSKKKDLRTQAKELINQVNEAWYDFSLVAAEISGKQSFLEWGFASAKEYVEEELGVDYRTWLYRVKMGQAIRKHGLSKADIADLGWAKFKEVATVIINEEISEEDTKELIENVREMSSRETASFVRNVRAEYADKPVVVKTTMKFRLVNDAVEIVEQALERAAELLGTDDEAKALEYVCADWLSVSERLNTEIAKQVEGWNAGS